MFAIFRKKCASWLPAAVLVVLTAAPASAFDKAPNFPPATATVNCIGGASLTVNASSLYAGLAYVIDYTITVTPASGPPATFSGSINATASASGTISTVSPVSLGYFVGSYTLSGAVQLYNYENVLVASNIINFAPNSLSCSSPAITQFSVTPSCSGYSITASAANLDPGTSYTMPYTITLTPTSGSPVNVTNTISFNADSNGNYNGTVPLTSFGYLAGGYTLSGTVQLKQGASSLASQSISFSPTSLSCPVPAITQFSVTPSCSGYTITNANAANLNPGTSYTMPYTITLTPTSGSPVQVSGTLSFTATSNGQYSGSLPLTSYTYLVGNYTATGTANLYQSSSLLASATIAFSPGSLTCTMPTACISIKELLSTNGGSSYQASETCTNALYAGNDSADYELTVTNCGTDNLEDVLINDAQLGISNFPAGALSVGQSITYTHSQIPELAVNPVICNLFNFSDTSIATGTGVVSGTKVTAQDTGCVSCISGGYESGTYPYCIYVLAPSATNALELQSSTIDASCGVIDDSSASQALLAQSSTLSATQVSVTGKYLEQSSTVKPTPTTGVSPEPNPLAYLPAPSYQTCSCSNSLTKQSVSSYTVPAGCYSSITMQSVGTVNFSPGTCVTGTITLQSVTTANFGAGNYVLNGVTMQSTGTVNFGQGTYVVNGNAVFQSTNISGSGVMFYITGGGALTMQSSSALTLSAPTSGTYSDILFFQAPADTSEATVQSDKLELNGVLYFPSANLVLQSGSATVTGGIIADQILLQSSDITVQELPLE